MNRMRFREIVLVVLIAGCGPVSTPNEDRPVAALPAFVTPLLGARDVTRIDNGEEQGFRYVMTAPYPAEALLRELQSQIPEGWISREESFLNPGIPTSQVRGWTGYSDESTTPPEWVHMWQGEWEDAAGLNLTITLMYRTARGPDDMTPLPKDQEVTVFTSVIPRAVLRQMRDDVPSEPPKVPPN